MKTCNQMVDSLIKRKEEYDTNQKKKKKKMYGIFIPICSIFTAALIGLGVWQSDFLKNNSEQILKDSTIIGEKDWYGPEETVDVTEDIALEHDDIWLYYVYNNEICREKRNLALSPEVIFNAWKEKNNIGSDVKLVYVNIDDNSTTTSHTESNGSGYVEHIMGDTFIYNISISKAIENYYDKINSELLLNSLKKTMTEWSSIKYNEYNLLLYDDSNDNPTENSEYVS